MMGRYLKDNLASKEVLCSFLGSCSYQLKSDCNLNSLPFRYLLKSRIFAILYTLYWVFALKFQILFDSQFVSVIKKRLLTSEISIYLFIMLSITSTGCNNGANLQNYTYSMNKKNEFLEIIRSMDHDKTVNTYLDLYSIKNIKITDRDKEVEIRRVLSAIEGEKGVFLEPKALDQNLYNFIYKVECANLVKELNRRIPILGNNDVFQYFDLIDTDDLVVIKYDDFAQKSSFQKEYLLEYENKNYNTPGGIFILHNNCSLSKVIDIVNPKYNKQYNRYGFSAVFRHEKIIYYISISSDISTAFSGGLLTNEKTVHLIKFVRLN